MAQYIFLSLCAYTLTLTHRCVMTEIIKNYDFVGPTFRFVAVGFGSWVLFQNAVNLDILAISIYTAHVFYTAKMSYHV